MKKFNVKKAFKSKNFKYGGYSALITALVLSIVVAVNLIAGKLNIKKDLTKDKLYSISEESYKILETVQKDIKIYAFFESGNEDESIKTILDKYKGATNKISVEYRDPLTQPQFAEKYNKNGNTVGVGSIVVESGSKFKTINYMDFYNYTYNENGQQILDSFAAEQHITNAIVYVNSEKQQTIYTLTGHEEKALDSSITKQLEVENYAVSEINLLQGNAQLNKDSLLVINAPLRDISKEEVEKIKNFLSDGGRAAFFIDITKESLPNLQELLSNYGVKTQNALIVEGQANMVANSAIALLPEIKSHDIVNTIKSKKLPLYMPLAQGIEELKLKRSGVKIEPLISSSSNSWGKTNINSTTMSKEKGDLEGPFNLAVAITEEGENKEKKSKLIVVGSTTFMQSDINASTNGTNLDFVMNSFNWLQDKKDSVTIRPKNLNEPNLIINALQRLVWSGIVVILIPAAIAVIGVVVWLRRRHR